MAAVWVVPLAWGATALVALFCLEAGKSCRTLLGGLAFAAVMGFGSFLTMSYMWVIMGGAIFAPLTMPGPDRAVVGVPVYGIGVLLVVGTPWLAARAHFRHVLWVGDAPPLRLAVARPAPRRQAVPFRS